MKDYYTTTIYNPDHTETFNATFKAIRNVLLVQVDYPDGSFTKKCVKVDPDNEFTFKIMKTKIKAVDGAAGLYNFLVNCYEKNFMVCNANKVLYHAAFTVREYLPQF